MTLQHKDFAFLPATQPQATLKQKMEAALIGLEVVVTDMTLADYDSFGDPIHMVEPHRELRETTGAERYESVGKLK